MSWPSFGITSGRWISCFLRVKSTLLFFFLFTFPQAVATKLDLPEDLVGYFSLFLIREGPDSSLTCECRMQLSQSAGQNKSTSLPCSYPSALGCVYRRSDGWFSFFCCFFSGGWNPSDSRRPHFTQTKKVLRHTLADRFEITFVQSAQPFRGDKRRGK